MVRQPSENLTRLKILPDHTADAFVNMANDLLLLEHFGLSGELAFRHYGWSTTALTFGYSQHFKMVKNQADNDSIPVCRRPTGGGVVDHRNDWTYSLIIPATHPYCGKSSREIYRMTHETLTEALLASGQPAETMNGDDPLSRNPTTAYQCFKNPCACDIVAPATRRKLAGAALKRTRHGLLLQGSIDKSAASQVSAWSFFQNNFEEKLATRLGAVTQAIEWPTIPDNMIQKMQNKIRYFLKNLKQNKKN